jgi:archaellum biogenesis protein FlaJ (TadC family)
MSRHRAINQFLGHVKTLEPGVRLFAVVHASGFECDFCVVSRQVSTVVSKTDSAFTSFVLHLGSYSCILP